MTNGFVTNAVLIERAVSCSHLHKVISQTIQYSDNWQLYLLQSELKAWNCWKSRKGGRVPMPHSWWRHWCLLISYATSQSNGHYFYYHFKMVVSAVSLQQRFVWLVLLCLGRTDSIDLPADSSGGARPGPGRSNDLVKCLWPGRWIGRGPSWRVVLKKISCYTCSFTTFRHWHCPQMIVF